jgi:hypothetical protein
VGETFFHKIEKVISAAPKPVLLSFKDIASGTINETITSGGVGEIHGSMLKLGENDPAQGIFFIAQDGTETKAPTLVRNKPANLIFMIPNGLAAGNYGVEVRALLHGTTEIRKGRLENNLTVI